MDKSINNELRKRNKKNEINNEIELFFSATEDDTVALCIQFEVFFFHTHAFCVSTNNNVPKPDKSCANIFNCDHILNRTKAVSEHCSQFSESRFTVIKNSFLVWILTIAVRSCCTCVLQCYRIPINST